MVPKTGMESGARSKAWRFLCTCLATSRRASAAPLRSNLLMATKSAKSSMSIFSSWLAAPYSGVITYRLASTSGTMAASPWPMPEVSTTIRSKPAHLQAATTSGRALESSLPASRVARERMKTRGPFDHGPMAFMRMRSPSSAPPLFLREGSMEMTAIESASSWSSRRRRTISSVRLDFPAPPVPVMPSVGTFFAAAVASIALRSAGSALPSSSTVMSRDSARHRFVVSDTAISSSDFGACAERSTSVSCRIEPIIPCRPRCWPSSGEKSRATP